MNLFFFSFDIISYILILYTNCLIPNWNFLNSTIDLLKNESSYIQIIKREWYGNELILKKQFIKDNNNIINQINTISFSKFNCKETKVNFENIESFYYFFTNYVYICPTGNNHLYIYDLDCKLKEIKNENYENKWNLKCYYQPDFNFIFIFYLQIGIICKFKIEDNILTECKKIQFIFNDFIWTINKSTDNNEYYMLSIDNSNEMLKYTNIDFTIRTNEYLLKSIKTINIMENLGLCDGNFLNFNNDYINYYGYWLTYNLTFFNYGYTKDYININNIKDEKNFIYYNFTFQYKYNFIIKSINFIRDSTFVYYRIQVNKSNEEIILYHGIIDIKTNSILFNTNETINQIQYFSSNSILIITNLSIYRLCLIAKQNDNDCINECDLGKELILDTNSNYCGLKEGNYCNNYIIKTYNICVNECDENIYIINNKNCYLCSDLDSKKIYKIYNENKCIENKPENTFYLNEKLKILKYCHNSCKTCKGDKENECLLCYDGFINENGKCVERCYKTCKDCIIKSIEEKEQKCTSCKDNKLLQEDKGNCINECLNGYYKEEKYCKKCDKSCLTCNNKYYNNSYHCTSCTEDKLLQEDNENCINECLNGYYKEEKYCKKCNSTCLTCNNKYYNNSPHCTSCKDNKILINDTQECKNECDISYYKNNTENKCYKCNSNCKSCSRNSIKDNNYCLSCNENSSFKYLINSTEYGFNCVEICPKNTILNEISKQCIYHEIKIQSTDNLFIWGFLIVFILFFFGCCILYILFQCNYPNDEGVLIDKTNKNLNIINELNEM